MMRLPAATASCLLLLAGGARCAVSAAGLLCAGTSAKMVDVYDLAGTGAPPRRLNASGAVNALLPLSGGGVAAGTLAGTVDLFAAPAAAAAPGGPAVAPRASLRASGPVYALLALPGGGVAAGTSAGTIDLFNASAVTGERAAALPYATLQAGAPVLALLALPDGGVAAGMHNAQAGSVELFATPVTRGGGPYVTLPATSEVSSLAAVRGGFAAGTRDPGPGTVDLYRGVDGAVARYAVLNATGWVFALSALPGSGLAAGTGRWDGSGYVGAVELFGAPAVAAGAAAPYAVLTPHSYPAALLLLPDGGLAAGTHAAAVDLFAAEQLRRGGAGGTAPRASLNASGAVYALALL